MNSKLDKRRLIFGLACAAVITLLILTWAASRLGAWVIYNDSVHGLMMEQNAKTEFWITGAFFWLGKFFAVAIEGIVGFFFLRLLWSHLYGRTPES